MEKSLDLYCSGRSSGKGQILTAGSCADMPVGKEENNNARIKNAIREI